MNPTPNMLVVDDEPDNRLILESYLQGVGYEVETARHGEEAWFKLIAAPNRYDIVLLDWMMPGQSGLEVLQQMQQHPQLRHVQVIMQTARARSEEIQKGIDAGAWYYLTKPFDEETLLAIVKTALTDRQNYLDMQYAVRDETGSLLVGNRFVIRTLEEAKNLAVLLARLCSDPERRGLGFLEILLNAIEHGNLGIGYEEKTRLLAAGGWEAEINRRLALPQYRRKMVEVLLERDLAGTLFLIKDQGQGFDWRKYVKFDPRRVTHTHGRGIAMAQYVSFDRLEYRGQGNAVALFVEKRR
ncbi:MAG: response regulator [Magnetococcales bacterium]|nr:response regulator [Magnetococcales bacterium]